MTDRIGPDLYRYSTTADYGGVHICCQRFIVVGETEHFYYVVSYSYHGYLQCLAPAHREAAIERQRRRVSKDGLRRHCYPDRAAALRSFIARQQRRMGHAQLNMSMAKLSLAEAERMLVADHISTGTQPCGHDEYTETLVWE